MLITGKRGRYQPRQQHQRSRQLPPQPRVGLLRRVTRRGAGLKRPEAGIIASHRLVRIGTDRFGVRPQKTSQKDIRRQPIKILVLDGIQGGGRDACFLGHLLQADVPCHPVGLKIPPEGGLLRKNARPCAVQRSRCRVAAHAASLPDT